MPACAEEISCPRVWRLNEARSSLDRQSTCERFCIYKLLWKTAIVYSLVPPGERNIVQVIGRDDISRLRKCRRIIMKTIISLWRSFCISTPWIRWILLHTTPSLPDRLSDWQQIAFPRLFLQTLSNDRSFDRNSITATRTTWFSSSRR